MFYQERISQNNPDAVSFRLARRNTIAYYADECATKCRLATGIIDPLQDVFTKMSNFDTPN